MRKARILAIAILPVMLAACGGGPNEDTGLVAGAVVGGIVGSVHEIGVDRA